MNNAMLISRILLSSMGVGGPKLTDYWIGAAKTDGLFSAFGWWQLLPGDEKADATWFLREESGYE